MKFDKDSFSRITPPQIVLNKASGERLGIINPTALTLDKKLNEPDELAFTLYLYTNDERDPYYDYVEEMMYIEIPGEARYVITSIDIVSEGSRQEHKDVVCKSYEWMLGTRYLEDFVINTGETESTDGVNFSSLLDMCLNELFPEWGVDAIYGDLTTVQRSFSVTRSSVYDFLMTEVAQAFECIFEFNSYTKKIRAYPQELYGVSSGVMVSYDNLLKTTNMTLNVEDIKTSLVLSGDEDVNIREVNRSNDRIYNFEYFNSTEFMSQSLYDAFNAWQTLTYHTPVDWDYLDKMYDAAGVKYFVFSNTKDLHNQYVLNKTVTSAEYNSFLTQNHLENNHNNLYTFLLNRYQLYYTDLSDWQSNNMPAGNNKRYFGYGTYPVGYPNNIDLKSTETFEIEKYTDVSVVSSLPSASSASATTLYLITNDSNFGMYRLYKGAWLNTNNWTKLALAPLQEKLKSAEKNMSAAMKNGYGSTKPTDPTVAGAAARQLANYNKFYLPYYYAKRSLEKYVTSCQATVNSCSANQSTISKALQGIANLTAMDNANTIKIKNGSLMPFRNPNFNSEQLKELSTFIREDELNASNYVVTDIMTDTERFDMLHDLLEYGTKELNKAAQPQMTFSANIVNLFGMPEFDRYAGYVDIGNTIVVYLRDDYVVKPRIVNIHYNFYDESDFTLTFSNILKKNKEYWSDVQDVLNEASSISTSYSFNASYWSQQAKNADTISQHLAEGLLNQGEFLKGGVHSEFFLDERGVFITTVSDDPSDPNYPYAKTSDTDTDYDSIFLGGGRILFTNDGWKTVKMSVGRGIVKYPKPNSSGSMAWQESSMFGVFADFVVSGYVGASYVVGGDIYSANYTTSSSVVSGNQGTHINLTNGTFEFNNAENLSNSNVLKGRKALRLDANGLVAYGKIYATEGRIGYKAGTDPTNNTNYTGFIIRWKDDGTAGGIGQIYTKTVYGEKDSIKSTNRGVYIGTDGIVLGPGGYGVSTLAPFYVTEEGRLRAVLGIIGGFTLDKTVLYNSSVTTDNWKTNVADNSNNSIALSREVFSRNLKGIGITSNNLVFAIGQNFGVETNGTVYAGGTIHAKSGSFGSSTYYTMIIGSDTTIWPHRTYIYSNLNGSHKNLISANADGIYLGTDGIGLGKQNTYTHDYDNNSGSFIHSRFEVDNQGHLWCKDGVFEGAIYATKGIIGGMNIKESSIGNLPVWSESDPYSINHIYLSPTLFGKYNYVQSHHTWAGIEYGTTSDHDIWPDNLMLWCPVDGGGYMAIQGSPNSHGSSTWSRLSPLALVFNEGEAGQVYLDRTKIIKLDMLNMSDIRLKQDIRPLIDQDSKDFIMKLNPVRFRFNEKVSLPKQFVHLGFIAQEVKNTATQIYSMSEGIVGSEGNNGYYSLNYTEIIAPLVNLVQQQQKMIEQLQEDIKGVKG